MGSPCLQLPDGTLTLTAAQSCKGSQQPWHPALPCARSRALVAAMAQGQSWGLLCLWQPLLHAAGCSGCCAWGFWGSCCAICTLLLSWDFWVSAPHRGAAGPPSPALAQGCTNSRGAAEVGQSRTSPGGTKQDKPWCRAGLGSKLLTFKYWGRPLRGGGQGVSAGAARDFSGWVKCWDLN